ncbi:MAG: hypothetical protein EOO38_27405, partial [Cytophagaceae bacterium]
MTALSTQFKAAYLTSLTSSFRSFYDDMHEYGNIKANNCIYFIHGIDGSPGQIRFALPAASRFFHLDVYIKGLYTAEFSCRSPIWDKYTRANLDRKVAKITDDLTELALRFGKVSVFCSSNGFYDFYAAYPRLSADTKAALTLCWVACAADHFDDTRWERIFFRLNGFVHGNNRWVALPNNNWLGWLNPEVPYRHRSKAGKPGKCFYKQDMESRFFSHGSLWSYFSLGCFNDCLDYLISQSCEKLTIPTYVLAAEYDGYWKNKTLPE